MKKLVSTVLSMALCLAPMTTALMNTTAAGEEDTSVFTVGSYVGAANDTTAEKPAFSAEKFFVVVGTYGGSTQLKYMYPDGSDGYSSDKVVLSKNYEEYSYGDILVADGELKMERVDSAPGDPIYRMAYHYTLSDESVLKKVGNCNELMEKKALTVTSTNYDGSAHWSIHLADKDGNEYYYGFSAFGSSLGVDPTDGEAGDNYIYVFNDGKLVIPLEKAETVATETTSEIITTTTTTIDTTTTTVTDTEIPDLGSDLGENLSWKLKGDVLVIYGTGDMNDFWFGSLFNDLQFSEVVLPDGLTRIGANAFANSDLPIDTPNGLRKVNIPDSVTSIGDWAFWGCKDLTEVTIPESVTTMGKDVFSNCPDLTIKGAAGSYAESYAKEYDIPFEAISGTTDSTTATTTTTTTTDTELPDHDEPYGEDITWKLKDGVLTIYGKGAMMDYIWQSPFSGDEYEEVVISDGITRIGVNTFASVGLSIEPPSKLARVSIPDSVTSIGDWAFYDCAELKEITIPESVTEMGKDVFLGCHDLTIKGVAGSYAESYAKEYDIPFEAISGTTDSTTTTTTSATTAAAATTTTSEAADTPKHIASDETFIQWAVNDYHEKTGAKNVSARIVSADDEKYQINIMDENDNVLDTYTIDPVSGTGTNSADENVDLPQTGMSGAHKMIAGMAALMTLTGAALIKKSRKEDEE